MIRAVILSGKDRVRQTQNVDEMASVLKARKQTIWIDFEEPTERELKLLVDKFGFHPLTYEDVVHGGQRPKIDDYDEYAFIIVRGVGVNGIDAAPQLNIYLDRTFIVTVNKQPIKGLNETLDKARRNPLLLKRGPDFVAYSVLDAIVDEFFPLIQELDDKIDELEDRIFVRPDNKILQKLFQLKHRTISIRRVAWPMRDILNILARRDFRFVKAENAVYFRDVYDHLVRITDMTDTLRDILTTSMEGYLSVISNNLNVVVKKLTALTALIMIPALIASVYGMNFVNMPELQWENGYYFSLGLMLVSAVVAYAYLKWRNWV